MTSIVERCPLCELPVVPGDDNLCPSCRAYDFSTQKVVDEAAAQKARARADEERPPGALLHPLAVLSGIFGAVTLMLAPIPAIFCGLVAGGLGWLASKEIRAVEGRRGGLWLARAGMVVGMGMAGAWSVIFLVGYTLAD